MPDRRDPPPTDEGWYALHDFRTIDWDAWRDAPERRRRRALGEAIDHLETRLAVEDAEEGASALYSVLGHKADLLLVHLRPSSAHIGALERQFEGTELAAFTDRTTSFVSVTEASGYSERARDYFEGDLDENSGLANYIQTRLQPTIPEATHVCFYPMTKRRGEEHNWYDLPFEERAEHMEAHGDIGRDYGGKVVQMITGAIALDDWEWGVTLWGDDLVDMKDLLYEMRFDPSTSRYAEFGQFYVGRRFPPADLPALLAGQQVPADGEAEGDLAASGPVHPADATADSPAETGTTAGSDDQGATATDHGAGQAHAGGHGAQAHASDESQAHGSETEGESHPGESSGGHTASGGSSSSGSPGGSGAAGGGAPPTGGGADVETSESDDLVSLLGTLGLHPGDEYTAGDYGLVLYSDADARELQAEVDDLRESFDHYDTHVSTTVRAQSGRSAVVSVWENERAADTALGFLTDLPGVTESIRGQLGEAETPSGAHGGASHTAESGDANDETGDDGETSIREDLADLDVYAGQPHGEDIYALVLYSQADLDALEAEVAELAEGFDRYDTHEGTSVYNDPNSATAAVVSLWETADAADTASDYLEDLPGVVGWADDTDGFGTMGMFYTVKPEHRDEFVGKFDAVGDLLAGMDGHRETALLFNTDDENDMFIASQWDSKEDAMQFFRSEEFTDTVDWGRDVLADRPRHVFLA